MNKFVYRMLCKNYETSAKRMLAEIKRATSHVAHINTAITEEYAENLKLLRMFLDNNGIPMPRPKWAYNDKDESTWLFTHRKGVNKTFLMLQARRR